MLRRACGLVPVLFTIQPFSFSSKERGSFRGKEESAYEEESERVESSGSQNRPELVYVIFFVSGEGSGWGWCDGGGGGSSYVLKQSRHLLE